MTHTDLKKSPDFEAVEWFLTGHGFTRKDGYFYKVIDGKPCLFNSSLQLDLTVNESALRCSVGITACYRPNTWAALKVSKQGAMDLLRPLVKAGLVKRVGTLKTGRSVVQ